MDRPLKETVYSPDSELLSFGKLMRNMWSDCWLRVSWPDAA